MRRRGLFDSSFESSNHTDQKLRFWNHLILFLSPAFKISIFGLFTPYEGLSIVDLVTDSGPFNSENLLTRYFLKKFPRE